MKKTLIAYFSGNGEETVRDITNNSTETVCNVIQEVVDADVFKITMKDPYSAEYGECLEEAKRDIRANARPEIIDAPKRLDQYEQVILAYPNYWGTMPMAVATFLENIYFEGKSILPVCTSEGNGMGSSERDLKRYAIGAKFKKGLAVRGSQAADSKADVLRWLKLNAAV